MRKLDGRLESRGPFIEVRVMATPQRVAVLKATGTSFPAPLTIRALIDTGASASTIDSTILRGLGLTPTGVVRIHTPSTGSQYLHRDQFDVCMAIGNPNDPPETYIIGVIGAELASEGFCALSAGTSWFDASWFAMDHRGRSP